MAVWLTNLKSQNKTCGGDKKLQMLRFVHPTEPDVCLIAPLLEDMLKQRSNSGISSANTQEQ